MQRIIKIASYEFNKNALGLRHNCKSYNNPACIIHKKPKNTGRLTNEVENYSCADI
jgi:hypothetical protein